VSESFDESNSPGTLEFLVDLVLNEGIKNGVSNVGPLVSDEPSFESAVGESNPVFSSVSEDVEKSSALSETLEEFEQ